MIFCQSLFQTIDTDQSGAIEKCEVGTLLEVRSCVGLKCGWLQLMRGCGWFADASSGNTCRPLFAVLRLCMEHRLMHVTQPQRQRGMFCWRVAKVQWKTFTKCFSRKVGSQQRQAPANRINLLRSTRCVDTLVACLSCFAASALKTGAVLFASCRRRS